MSNHISIGDIVQLSIPNFETTTGVVVSMAYSDWCFVHWFESDEETACGCNILKKVNI